MCECVYELTDIKRCHIWKTIWQKRTLGTVQNHLECRRPIIPRDTLGYIYNNLQHSSTPFRSVFSTISPTYVSSSSHTPSLCSLIAWISQRFNRLIHLLCLFTSFPLSHTHFLSFCFLPPSLSAHGQLHKQMQFVFLSVRPEGKWMDLAGNCVF